MVESQDTKVCLPIGIMEQSVDAASGKPRYTPVTLWMIIADVVALEVALLLGCLLRLATQPIVHVHIGRAQYQGLALGVLTLPFAYYWVGLYPGYGMGSVKRLRNRVYSTLLVFTTLLAWNHVFADAQWSRGILLCTMVFALLTPPAFEFATRKVLGDLGMWGLPAVVLGANKTGRLIVEKLGKHPDLGLNTIAILDDDPEKWGTSIGGIQVTGPLSSVGSLQGKAKVAVVALPGFDRERLVQLVQGLAFSSIILVPDLLGVQTLWTVSRDIGGVLGLELQKNLLVRKNRFLKRVLDYAIALPMFALATPLIAVFALWIKAVSHGPAFFCQEREGADGRRINVWKLRTMFPNAQEVLHEYLEANPEQKATWFRYYKLKKDPRVLPGIGTFLRRLSLDELPQLWNVLAGDMSLVGPRPFPLYHMESFPEGFRRLRTSVPPGLTGLWQVSDRSNGDIAIQEMQDTYYIHNWSVWLDIYILLRTVKTVVGTSGAY